MSEPFQRFVDSMQIDYEKWHDGIGYDLDALAAASDSEREQIERLLVPRAGQDWRDVEALAALGTPGADDALRRALRSGSAEIRNAVTSYAPHLLVPGERTEVLVDGLEHAAFGSGLTQTLLHVEDHHPPEVVDALLRGALHREPEVACHFAAMLFYVHGKAASAFDWDHRPLFLRFSTPVRADREAAFRDLCQQIGVDASRYL